MLCSNTDRYCATETVRGENRIGRTEVLENADDVCCPLLYGIRLAMTAVSVPAQIHEHQPVPVLEQQHDRMPPLRVGQMTVYQQDLTRAAAGDAVDQPVL